MSKILHGGYENKIWRTQVFQGCGRSQRRRDTAALRCRRSPTSICYAFPYVSWRAVCEESTSNCVRQRDRATCGMKRTDLSCLANCAAGGEIAQLEHGNRCRVHQSDGFTFERILRFGVFGDRSAAHAECVRYKGRPE